MHNNITLANMSAGDVAVSNWCPGLLFGPRLEIYRPVGELSIRDHTTTRALVRPWMIGSSRHGKVDQPSSDSGGFSAVSGVIFVHPEGREPRETQRGPGGQDGNVG